MFPLCVCVTEREYSCRFWGKTAPKATCVGKQQRQVFCCLVLAPISMLIRARLRETAYFLLKANCTFHRCLNCKSVPPRLSARILGHTRLVGKNNNLLMQLRGSLGLAGPISGHKNNRETASLMPFPRQKWHIPTTPSVL